jgi:hypothetical protein
VARVSPPELLRIRAMYSHLSSSHEVRRESHQEEVANRCRIVVLSTLLRLFLRCCLFSSLPLIRYSYSRNVCYFVFTITKGGGGRVIGPRRIFYDIEEI